MGLSFILNLAFWLTGHRRGDTPRDVEKQDSSSAQVGVDYSGPHDILSSDDEDHYEDEEHPNSNWSSGRFRRFGTFGSMLSGPGPSLTFTRTWTMSTSIGPTKPSWLSRLRSFFFPRSRPGETREFVPNYRYSPIFSGVVIPFSILLEIPGLTERWYVRTIANQVVKVRPNPAILSAGMGISMGCAVLANICIILRFSEKSVKTVTLLCIFFLTLHDCINIAAVTAFGVIHRVDDGFVYGQSFWITLCSTIASTTTNLSLIYDFVHTKDFAKSGSGLTRKQRSLVILVIILLMYIAFGSLINSEMLSLSYIDGLYFTVVSIETIGFGDIVPSSTGGRVFICFYIALGMILLGIVISLCRKTVLEGLDISYQKRLRGIRARRREARRFRRWQTRWRRAIEYRLRQQGSPVWVSDAQRKEEEGVRFVGLGGPMAGAGEPWLARFIRFPKWRRPSPDDPAERQTRHVLGHPLGKHLNINALNDDQLHSAALEAGVPLNMFVDLSQASRDDRGHPSLPDDAWPTDINTPTDAQLGRMAAMLTRMAMAMSGRDIQTPGPAAEDREAVTRAVGQAQDEEQEAGHEHGRGGDSHVAETTRSIRKAKDNGHHLHGRYITAPKWLRKYAASALSANPHAKLKKEMADDEKNAGLIKLFVAWAVFFIFWFVGSAIFSATEGWAYGTAMYFCFISFSTTGYGDLTPASPAGRSIFVVWALFGVGTLTVLVAVVEDAGSSKYEGAMHSQVFERAVQKYRKHAAVEVSEVPHAEQQLYRAAQNRFWSTDALRSGILTMHPDQTSLETIRVQLEDAQQKAQRELESLPQEIIQQARTFHDYMHFFLRGGGHDGNEPANVPRALRQFLDEILEGEHAGERVKQEILADDDAKHTLFIMSIERALKRMIHSADSAMQAVADRDTLLAIQEEQRSRVHQSTSGEVLNDSEAPDSSSSRLNLSRDEESDSSDRPYDQSHDPSPSSPEGSPPSPSTIRHNGRSCSPTALADAFPKEGQPD